ncbi:cell adhesion domain-containing protein [Clostridium hydrogenum]|uniref:cell adhesion domain-containing protein n=1 Tax=Clostridium hydrogenum TaxID=2855764 RepID=UPI001F407F90|nr:cell adhesion domain-containing protein [Clostridium hydrogenum]
MKKVKTLTITLFLLFFTLIVPSKVFASTYDGKTLDASIYWFGKGNVSQKFISGQANPYFDPTKPTLIYIHGWQNGAYKTLHRESFNPSLMDADYGANVNSADYWINAGWNIGIFYWNQFSDEPLVNDAEAKIWSPSGPQGMRWRLPDGSFQTTNTPNESAAQLFVDQYVQAMKGFSGSEIRLVGHSLGNQMVINGGEIISNMVDDGKLPANLRPNRIALLDPYWSSGAKSYLGNKWTGAVCRDYVTNLKNKGVVFEQYKTSDVDDFVVSDRNLGMEQLTDYNVIHSDFIPIYNISSKHRYARDWYFYSYAFNPPSEIENGVLTGNMASSAKTPTSRIAQMMNSGYYWNEVQGTLTYTPGDDAFSKVAK